MKDSIEKRITEYFMNKKEVVAVYLFGSYARGKEKPFSDIDIGIIFKPLRRDKYRERIDGYIPGLSRILRCDVHLVIMNTAGEELLRQVFTKGKCLMVANPKLLSSLKTVMYSQIAEFGFYRPMMQKGLIGKIMEETTSG